MEAWGLQAHPRCWPRRPHEDPCMIQTGLPASRVQDSCRSPGNQGGFWHASACTRILPRLHLTAQDTKTVTKALPTMELISRAHMSGSAAPATLCTMLSPKQVVSCNVCHCHVSTNSVWKFVGFPRISAHTFASTSRTLSRRTFGDWLGSCCRCAHVLVERALE